MGLISPTLPSQGAPRGSEEVDVLNALQTIVAAINGDLDVSNLDSTVLQALGLSDGSNTRRGKSIIATEESRTNTAYGTLTTPDRVSGVVLPTDGLIVVAFQAEFKNSVANAGRAAIFLGANQVKGANPNFTSPQLQEISGNATVDTYRPVATIGPGLSNVNSANAYPGDVTTGQVISASIIAQTGGPTHIFAAAGTYDVSIQWAATSGTVTAKNRKLWVWTMGF